MLLYNESITDKNNVPQLLQDASLALAAVKGLLEGVVAVSNFGRVSGVQALDPPLDVWDGKNVYTGFPTGAAETLEILSDNIADTNGGTGAWNVTILGLLDGDGNAMPPVTVDLDGETEVSLGVQMYYRASKIIVNKAGSTGSNVGTLTLRHTVTIANVFGIILPTNNTTNAMVGTVPAGKRLYVYRGAVNLSLANGQPAGGNIQTVRRLYGANNTFVPVRNVEITTSGPYLIQNFGYFVFEPRTDLKTSILAVSSNGSTISAENSAYLMDI